MKKYILCLIFISTQNLFALPTKVTFELEGLTSKDGKVTVVAFENSDGFPMAPDKAKLKNSFRATELGDQPQVSIELEVGKKYSILVHHDRNENDQIETNFLGIPKESVAVSNNAKGKMGAPRFEDALIDVQENLHQKLKLSKQR